MPNVLVSIYLNDEQYKKYAKNKKELNKSARIAFFTALTKNENKNTL